MKPQKWGENRPVISIAEKAVGHSLDVSSMVVRTKSRWPCPQSRHGSKHGGCGRGGRPAGRHAGPRPVGLYSRPPRAGHMRPPRGQPDSLPLTRTCFFPRAWKPPPLRFPVRPHNLGFPPPPSLLFSRWTFSYGQIRYSTRWSEPFLL